ncbi:MAG: SH3 domain-containing protein, partial [Lachnospiraceae bacterium]
ITPNVEKKLVVHKTPSGEGKDDVKGYLYLGAKAKVLRKEDGWYKIESGKLMGWVSESNVFVDEEADEFLEQVNPRHVTVKEEKLNLYTEKDKDSDIVAELSEGMKFMLLDKDDDWYEIRFTPSVTGFVEKSGVMVKKGAISGVRFNVIDEYEELIEKQEKIREEEAAREAAERAAAERAAQMEVTYSQNGA